MTSGTWIAWDQNYREMGLNAKQQAKEAWPIAQFFKNQFLKGVFLGQEHKLVNMQDLESVAFKKAIHFLFDQMNGSYTIKTPEHNPECDFEKRGFDCPDGITRIVEYDTHGTSGTTNLYLPRFSCCFS